LACFVWFFPWDCASKPASKPLASLKNCYVMHWKLRRFQLLTSSILMK
jgi:hypothetical protein